MTQTFQVEVENIKCGGCENSIVKGINSVAQVSNLVIDREKQLVSFEGEASIKQSVIDKLRSMGYPEKGSVAGLEAGITNAKSFVSCAIGRMT
ncbi:heavy-metal-associated domain-containing protein [Limnohabitans sp. Rim11]|jgi:copper chaperone|uniref:heavy-metal-associated domain-containing protein n=1 Tax=Limnohabitans sp. Rim11 TaxID=1100719 RepID=UPI000A3ED266|nr:heavy-metal-associated domain-containing protein [Limnohabitans sp. Rim11]